jgi:hypothetical protein
MSKKHTIKEIEIESEETLDDAMREFIEDCYQQGLDDATDNIRYFMRESSLATSEYSQVYECYFEQLKLLGYE